MVKNQLQGPEVKPRLPLYLKILPVLLIIGFGSALHYWFDVDPLGTSFCCSTSHLSVFWVDYGYEILLCFAIFGIAIGGVCLVKLVSFIKKYGLSKSTFFWVLICCLSVALIIDFLFVWRSDTSSVFCECYYKEPAPDRFTELLALGRVSLEAPKDVEGEFYFGIQNPNVDRRCYQVLFKCIKSLSGAKCDPSQNPGNDIAVGGSSPSQYVVSGGAVADKWFRTFTNVTLDRGTVKVYPAAYKISVGPETYLMEIDAFQSDALGNGCANATWTNSTKPWQSKQFYVKVT